MPRYVFAAARDGDMLLDHIEAVDIDQATADALLIAKDHHGIRCPDDEIEGELDGFAIIDA